MPANKTGFMAPDFDVALAGLAWTFGVNRVKDLDVSLRSSNARGSRLNLNSLSPSLFCASTN
jgi:hypothetical protein